MHSQTMPFIRGRRYQFRVTPKGPHVFSELSKNTVTLTYLRDCKGDGKVIHHIFQWGGRCTGMLHRRADERLRHHQEIRKAPLPRDLTMRKTAKTPR